MYFKRNSTYFNENSIISISFIAEEKVALVKIVTGDTVRIDDPDEILKLKHLVEFPTSETRRRKQ